MLISKRINCGRCGSEMVRWTEWTDRPENAVYNCENRACKKQVKVCLYSGAIKEGLSGKPERKEV